MVPTKKVGTIYSIKRFQFVIEHTFLLRECPVFAKKPGLFLKKE